VPASQLGLGLNLSTKKTRKREFLDEMDRVVPWGALVQIVEPHDSSSVNYRLRQYSGAWKVIDVYYQGVSQLATERADFAGVLAAGGPPALVAKLNELTAKMR